MKKYNILRRLFPLLIILMPLLLINSYPQPNRKHEFVLVVHGGAGNSIANLPDSLKVRYYSGIENALKAGQKVLAGGGSAIDAVEQAIRVLEDNPNFNAGRGSVLNADGKVEMDASIMSGIDLSCGAVTGVTTVKNPISLARLVMDKTKHVLLAGYGAEQFAAAMGVERKDSTYFIVPERYDEWKNYKASHEKHGTVGAVALDKYGNLAAGTSTGGMAGKMPGRVGDSPLIGIGTYANKTCAVSCTGWGEKFIKNTVAFNISALMDYKGYSLQKAVNEMIFDRLTEGDGGLIAVDREGNYQMIFNTKGMFRGAATEKGIREIIIEK